MKKVYFATVCLLPPALAVLIPLIFLGPLNIPPPTLLFVFIYFWVGLVILLIDLWRSKRTKETKVLWTFLNLLLGIVTLPIYWFIFIRRDNSG